MKTGLIMEGGAMRGMFTAGVIDVMMENGIRFDGAIGVSAGAVFGCNYKSMQIGRVIRYNKRFCTDKRYCSFGSWLKTGDLYNADFDYRVVPRELDVFDQETYQKNPMEFYIVATDAHTGKAVYKRLDNGDDHDILWMRASASMPLLSRMVEIDGGAYSDGGSADSVPLRYFEEIGYDRNVVILTQPPHFRKEKNKLLWLLKIGLRKYPNLYHALAVRHLRYNETMEYIEQAEKDQGNLLRRIPRKGEYIRRHQQQEKYHQQYKISVASSHIYLPVQKETGSVPDKARYCQLHSHHLI